VPQQKPGEVDPNRPHVSRLAVPPEGAVSFHDLITGDVTCANRTVDDAVLLTSDVRPPITGRGWDDHAMNISHATADEAAQRPCHPVTRRSMADA
jgi:glutamyl-tRNA synthetase